MGKFKVGDTIRVRVECAGNKIGELIVLSERATDGLQRDAKLWARDCSCQDYWELAEKEWEE